MNRISRAATLLVVASFAMAMPGAADPPDGDSIDPDAASRYFGEIEARCREDGGELWGVSLCGPVLFAVPASREAVANRADVGGVLREARGVFVGPLPDTVNVANTALEWSGVRWTMLPWPPPEDPESRAVLLLHESFHRIQPELGMTADNPHNAHLDTLRGRYWLQLEWRALSSALRSRGGDRARAIADALAFREQRRSVFPESAETENALERNEGLAEYTGVRLGARNPEERTAAVLLAASEWPTFVRSFAYASGPAYGLLLDAVRPEWRNDLAPEADLGALLAEAVTPLPADPAARAMAYGGGNLLGREKERAEDRARRTAAHRDRLVDGPVLILPFRDMRISFDPLGLQPLDELGTVYPTLRITDAWGILEVDSGGAFVDRDWSRAHVPADFERRDAVVRGEGWVLRLESGWRIGAGEREGDFRLEPEAETVPSGSLCFDEGHHNVHTSTRGYEAFADLARDLGFSILPISGPWTPGALGSCDLLVSASPRGAPREATLQEKGEPAFSTAEAEALVDWIRAGGSLLLVTDHPPIGDATAPLAERLGLDMGNAFTEDPENRDPEGGFLVFSRENGLLGSHPVTEGGTPADRIEVVGAFLGQSLAGPPGAVSFLTLGDEARDRVRTATDRHWIEPSSEDPLRPAGGRSQGLAFSLGAGRVIVLGDAAMLTRLPAPSGFAVDGLDNRRLAANILRWLSRDL